MTLELALDRYSAWQTTAPLLNRPVVIQELSPGSAHRVVRVRGESPDGHRDFAVRFPAAKVLRIAPPFIEELAILRRAATAALAPRVVYASPPHELLVMEFIVGDSLVSASQLGTLMRKIHSLSAEGPTLNLWERLGFYAQVAEERGVRPHQLIDPNAAEIIAGIEQLHQEPAVLCHNDLGPGNVLAISEQTQTAEGREMSREKSQGGTIAIDWEYAAVGSPYFDVAAACASWPHLSEETILFTALGSSYNEQCWRAAKLIYRAIEWNWYQSTGAPKPDHVAHTHIDALLGART